MRPSRFIDRGELFDCPGPGQLGLLAGHDPEPQQHQPAHHPGADRGDGAGRQFRRGEAIEDHRLRECAWLDGILSAARKNFEIPYDHVERAVLDGGRSNVTMPTLKLWASGKKMMFAFTQSMWRKDHAQMAFAKQLLSAVMPGRIEFQRI